MKEERGSMSDSLLEPGRALTWHYTNQFMNILADCEFFAGCYLFTVFPIHVRFSVRSAVSVSQCHFHLWTLGLRLTYDLHLWTWRR